MEFLKQADHHHVPKRVEWRGNDCILMTMESIAPRRDPIRVFVKRTLIESLRGDLAGDLLAVFTKRRPFFQAVADRLYGLSGGPIEIVLDEREYPHLRAGLVVI